MILYDLERSGNCYKIRLFLAILQLDYQKIAVKVNAGEQKTDEFLALNPRGQIPVLIDEDTTVSDSAAILVFLARKYGDERWLPLSPTALSDITRWLVFEQNEGRYGLARARAVTLKNPTPFARMGNIEECHRIGQQALEILEHQLTRTKWLLNDEAASIADIACYPYTALSGDGGLSLDEFPAIQRWISDVQALPGYVDLPRVG